MFLLKQVTSWALVMFLVGCSSPQKKESVPEKPQLQTEIIRVPARILTLEENQILSVPSIRISYPTPEQMKRLEMHKQEYGIWAGTGAGSLVMGSQLMGTQMFAGSLVFGGYFLLGGAALMAAVETNEIKIIQSALEQEDFSSMVESSLKGWLPDTPWEAGADVLEVTLLVYGVVTHPNSPGVCFIVTSEVVLFHEGGELYRDIIYIEPFIRSDDAPPPECFSQARLASDDAKLLRRAIKRTSETLAGIITHRLPGLPWKK
ncbi:hypothetical protein ACFL1G_10620 [Planctomycetota bacterium]